MTEDSKRGPAFSPSLWSAYSGTQLAPLVVLSGAVGLLAANIGICKVRKGTGLKAGPPVCPAVVHFLMPADPVSLALCAL